MDTSVALTTPDSILGGGWKLVRRTNAGIAWHQASDNCEGTDVYGTASNDPTSTTSFSINFQDAVPQYDEMLFATGDLTKWLVTRRDEVEVIRDNSPAVLLSSSENGDRSAVTWKNRLQATAVVTGMWFDLHADKQIGDTPTDSISGMVMHDYPVETGSDGVKYWNLPNTGTGALTRRSGATITEGQYYTHAYVIKWRESDDNWRPLLRHDNLASSRDELCGVVLAKKRTAGMYSYRDGKFRSSKFEISPQQSRWELVVITGAGDSATSATGSTTWYVLHIALEFCTVSFLSLAPCHHSHFFYFRRYTQDTDFKMHRRGVSSDRVCSGMVYHKIGSAGLGPGKIARVTTWNKVLTASEIDALPSQLLANFVNTPEDPYISVVDHNVALSAKGLLYAENSFASYTAILTDHQGANVFIRNSATRAVVNPGQHIERCYCPAGTTERLVCASGSYSMPESSAVAFYRASCSPCVTSDTCQGGIRKAKGEWEGLCETSNDARIAKGKSPSSGCSALSKGVIKLSDTMYACSGMWGANEPGSFTNTVAFFPLLG
jgi:hypothetical protein